MLFGEEASGKFLDRWPMFFRPHITEDAKGLVPTLHVEELLSSAEGDSDGGRLSSFEIFVNLYLLFHIYNTTYIFNTKLFRMGP